MPEPTRPPRTFPTRVLLSAAAFGAAGAVFETALMYLAVPTGAVAYFVYTATIGFWALPILAAQAFLRRPGIALLVALLMGLISAPFVGGGAQYVLNLVVAGALFELPFLVTVYRRWSTRMFWIAHPVSLLLYTGIYPAFVVAAFEAPAWWVWILMGLGAVVTAFATTGLGLLIASRLHRAGLGGRVPGVAS